MVLYSYVSWDGEHSWADGMGIGQSVCRPGRVKFCVPHLTGLIFGHKY